MRLTTLLLVLGLVGVSCVVRASPRDPAVVDVQALTGSLLRAMRAGPSLSTSQRYHELEPVIEQVFALPLMTRLSVGPEWASLAPEQQNSLIAAFSRYTIANYAHDFRNFDGQRFEISENVVNRGAEKIVRSLLVPRDDSPATLLYRIVSVGGNWKIVDVYYDGVSQLTLHRADFAGAIAAGGAPALVAHLNRVSNDLMR